MSLASNLFSPVAACIQTVDLVAQELQGFARVEADLLEAPGAEWNPPELIHMFAPGIYIRQIRMNPGYVLGAQHAHEHFNIVLSGRLDVFMEGAWQKIEAPCTIKSEVNVRKFLLVHEPTVWQTIHANPDNETDIPTLEARLFIYTDHFKRKRAEWEQSQQKESS